MSCQICATVSLTNQSHWVTNPPLPWANLLCEAVLIAGRFRDPEEIETFFFLCYTSLVLTSALFIHHWNIYILYIIYPIQSPWISQKCQFSWILHHIGSLKSSESMGGDLPVRPTRWRYVSYGRAAQLLNVNRFINPQLTAAYWLRGPHNMLIWYWYARNMCFGNYAKIN